MASNTGTRAAEAGELCTCGRPAATVYTGGRFGDTGGCGIADGGARLDGVCTFCGDTVDHAYYWRAEAAAGRPSMSMEVPQGERCPLYRLRLADPPPGLPPGRGSGTSRCGTCEWCPGGTRLARSATSTGSGDARRST